ncbi:apolipoprotein N-acyltransferase [Actinomadura parmotrematis]|uniref:Apolipoprotein N-acyltransferase n=1 Tax=Actinomadura parmotrematis TaxID=2864039 RepID=A0ABS7FSR8_9ACTN|nr:apolipoprotein N-acyltransferase [Actinomadura parmotrematis]MBW8483448.1 apolipoprotein N-acyltransferase [Actinomadura parmotrematis]
MVAQETLSGRQPESPPAPGPGVGRAAVLRRGGRAGWPRTLLAVAAGPLMWAAFPPQDLTPLAPVGVAMLAAALYGQRARTGAWLGLLAGLAFFLPVLTGIARIGPDAWAGLSLVEALYWLPLGALGALVTRLRGWPVWSAALWVADEALRGRAPFGGFPWARLAFSQTATPLTPYAALGGAPLVTFVTALIGGLLAYAALAVAAALRTHRASATAAPEEGSAGPEESPAGGGARVLVRAVWRAVWRPVAVAAAGGALLVGGGLAIPVPTGGRPVTVAVVQGNVPRLGLDFLGQRRAVLDNHVSATRRLAAQVRAGTVARPELVVWPENASDLDPYREADAYAAIDGAVKDIGVPVLVGALVDTPDGTKVENRGIVWDPRTGPGNYYVKRHPVPFGEYVPFREVLTKMIKRFELVPRDFAKGTRSGVMRLGPVDIGDVICFEVAYDQEVRDVARGNVLVVQTNNATYGRTTLPPQQIAMSRLRAVEHGRTILVAATSGISAIVAPDGRMIHRSREFVPDVAVAGVAARTGRTVADRAGAGPEWALTALGLGAAAAAGVLGRRKNEGN